MNTPGALSVSTLFLLTQSSSILMLEQASVLDLQVVRPRSAAGAAAGSAGRSLVHNG